MKDINTPVRIAGGLVLPLVLAGLPLFTPAHASDLTSPIPVSRDIPEPPRGGQFGPGPEGWVKVRFSVLADGTTADVRAVDAMPPRLSPRAVIAAVKKWTFKPATEDGVPIDWYNNEGVIVFDIEELPGEPSTFFMGAYRNAEKQMNEGNYQRARSSNANMLRNFTWRLYEIGLAQVQSALIEIKLEDYHAALQAVRRATEPLVELLQPEEMKVVLKYRFAVEMKLGRYIDALKTLERLQALEPLPADETMLIQSQAVAEALNGDAALAIKARIDGDPWVHSPARRIFTVADLEGRLNEITAECDRRKTVLPFQPDVEWTLPDSWGACTLFFDGKMNTTFTVYEFK